MEVACEPNSGVDSESKLVDHPVPLAIDVPEVDWMVSSRLISVWTFHIRAGEVEVMGCEGFHRGPWMISAPIQTRQVGEECSQVFRRNALNVLEGTCTARLTREAEGIRGRPVKENSRKGSPFTGSSLGMKGQQQIPGLYTLSLAAFIAASGAHWDGPRT